MATIIKPESEERIDFPVTGMTCAACQARVQRALRSEPGVADATVNLVTNRAAVVYDPATVSPQRLIDTVRATGYDASLPAARDEESGDSDRAGIEYARDLSVQVVVSLDTRA